MCPRTKSPERELRFRGTFAPWERMVRELSLHGTFAPMEFSLLRSDCSKNFCSLEHAPVPVVLHYFASVISEVAILNTVYGELQLMHTNSRVIARWRQWMFFSEHTVYSYR